MANGDVRETVGRASSAREALHRLLRYAVSQGASDLHLIVGVPPILRVHGELIAVPGERLTRETAEALCLSILTEGQREIFERDWSLCIGYTARELGYFRVTLYRHKGNVEGAIRIGRQQLMTLEETGLPEVVKELARKTTGLVLIVGPAGSGKTTSFYALLDFINRERRCKIITVEDPVEYYHSNRLSVIVQQEVGTDVKDFASALVQILRQDPNVIGIGEIRDRETLSIALQAAETGHLVLATLHTGRAVETINRIIDMFPGHEKSQARSQLSGVLQAIICQRLLPRIDKPGRILAYEILFATTAVRSMIREAKGDGMLFSAMQTGQEYGMQILENHLKDLYEQGIITYETAISNAQYPDRIRPGAELEEAESAL